MWVHGEGLYTFHDIFISILWFEVKFNKLGETQTRIFKENKNYI